MNGDTQIWEWLLRNRITLAELPAYAPNAEYHVKQRPDGRILAILSGRRNWRCETDKAEYTGREQGAAVLKMLRAEYPQLLRECAAAQAAEAQRARDLVRAKQLAAEAEAKRKRTAANAKRRAATARRITTPLQAYEARQHGATWIEIGKRFRKTPNVSRMCVRRWAARHGKPYPVPILADVPRSHGSSLTVADIERTAQAYSMRQGGAGWQEIGRFLNLKYHSAEQRVQAWARRNNQPWPIPRAQDGR